MISSDSNFSCSKDTTEKRKKKYVYTEWACFFTSVCLITNEIWKSEFIRVFLRAPENQRTENLFSWLALIWLPPVFFRHQAIKHHVAQTDLRLTETRLPLAHPESSFRNASWALWQTPGIMHSCCFSSLPSPSVISPLRPLSYSELPVFSWVTAAGWQLQGHTVRNTESSLLAAMELQRGAVAAAAKHAGPSSPAGLWSPDAGGWPQPGLLWAPDGLANMASQNPRAPAAAEMLLRSKPLRNSEQNPGGQRQSHMASQGQWLPGNSLKPARALAPGLEPCQRLNSGMGGLVTFSFSSQLDCSPGSEEHIWKQEATIYHFPFRK